MTSKEMEARSGVPRANIRYYEAEGLLTPARAKNGYRQYSEADGLKLEKIKLLRRLGISIEQLKAIEQNQLALADALAERRTALTEERQTLGRVERVCSQLETAGETFGTLNPEKYLQTLDASEELPALPLSDTLPTVGAPIRRLLARVFDWFLLVFLLLILWALLGRNPAQLNDALMNLTVCALLFFGEPLALHLWGATPGKALLGLRITAPDGGRLSYSDGMVRLARLAWHGLGLGIPIFSLVQLYRSACRACDEEPLPWDENTAYTAKPFRFRQIAAMMAVLAVTVALGEATNAHSQLPPNRGELTVARFAENFNRQAAYMGIDFTQTLNEEGQWTDRPQEANTVAIEISPAQKWPEARQFQYTVQDGRLTAVTLVGHLEDVTDWYSLPTDEMAAAVAAFVWARKDAPLLGNRRIDQLEKISAAEPVALYLAGTETTLDITHRGFMETDMGWLIPETEGDNLLDFKFTVALSD